jgi:hypothetical protein
MASGCFTTLCSCQRIVHCETCQLRAEKRRQYETIQQLQDLNAGLRERVTGLEAKVTSLNVEANELLRLYANRGREIKDLEHCNQLLRERVQTQQATLRVQDALLAGREKPVFYTNPGSPDGFDRFARFQKRNGVVQFNYCEGENGWITPSSTDWNTPEWRLAYRQAQES